MSTETGTDVDENNDSEEDNDINPSDNSELIPPGKKYKSRHRKTFKPGKHEIKICKYHDTMHGSCKH